MPNDLILLSRLHFLLHFFAKDPENLSPCHLKRHGYVPEGRYRCEILKTIIE